MSDARPVFPEGRQLRYERAGYSAGVLCGGFVFVSGQVGSDDAGDIVDGVGAQTVRAFANLASVLNAAGCTVADIVDMTIFIVDMPANFDVVNRIKTDLFPRPPFPAVTAVGVAALWGPCLVEIKVIARLPQAAG